MANWPRDAGTGAARPPPRPGAGPGPARRSSARALITICRLDSCAAASEPSSVMLIRGAPAASEVNSSTPADGSRSESSRRSSSIRSRCASAHAARSSVAGMNTRTVSWPGSSSCRSNSARSTVPSGNSSFTSWSTTRATCSTPGQRHAPPRRFRRHGCLAGVVPRVCSWLARWAHSPGSGPSRPHSPWWPWAWRGAVARRRRIRLCHPARCARARSWRRCHPGCCQSWLASPGAGSTWWPTSPCAASCCGLPATPPDGQPRPALRHSPPCTAICGTCGTGRLGSSPNWPAGSGATSPQRKPTAPRAARAGLVMRTCA